MNIELTEKEIQLLTGILGGYLRDVEGDEEFKDSEVTARNIFTKLLKTQDGCPVCGDYKGWCKHKEIKENGQNTNEAEQFLKR